MSGSLDSATVLDFNPSLRCAVVDVGLQQGARVGMPLVVFRNGREVAILKVVEVRKKVCGAVVERVAAGISIVKGDAVRVRGG